MTKASQRASLLLNKYADQKKPDYFGPDFLYDLARPHVKKWGTDPKNLPKIMAGPGRSMLLNKLRQAGTPQWVTDYLEKSETLKTPEDWRNVFQLPGVGAPVKKAISNTIAGLSDEEWNKKISQYAQQKWTKYKNPLLMGGGLLAGLWLLSRRGRGRPQQAAQAYPRYRQHAIGRIF